METVSLYTKYEEILKNQPIPYPEYPRPQLKRDSFMNLNGLWSFTIRHKENVRFKGDILVPFAPESRISGVERSITKGDELIYERDFQLEGTFIKEKTVLHIDACDQICRVYVNDELAGKNIGGYIRFSVDISDFVRLGKNSLRIVAVDDMDLNLPYGKQTSKRGGMWYTKISGIWQTVWLESLPKNHIDKIKITPNLKGVDLEIIGGKQEKQLFFQGKEYSFSGDKFRLEVEKPILWTPENPHLYDFKLVCGDDAVESYFALRTIEIITANGKQRIALNGEPYFFNGVLDQGYYSDGIFLPATSLGFEEDILKMKECGFNMLRKHIKVEAELFYYYCDKLGMAVFQDFVNSGKYSFFFDTALPTVGIKKRISFSPSDKRKYHFRKTALETMDMLYNHPSVVYYTIFNEGWGQHDADEYYKEFKSYDNTRIFDSTSGWFKKKQSDVESPHVYFKPIKLKPSQLPIVLSEFGGYSYKIDGHSFNLDKNYGYRTYKDKSSFEEGITDLYKNQVIPAVKQGLCAAVLTQLSDVEDETNGLLTYDRELLKLPAETLMDISNQIQSEFKKAIK